MTWTPEVEVTGCTVKRIPTRGFLLTTRRKVVVSRNRFVRIYRNGINIEGDTSKWFESGCVRDMTISDNLFDRCGKEAILITPRHRIPNPCLHRNISIHGNRFILPEGGSAVKACGTKGLRVTGNRIELNSDLHSANTIVANDCDDVSVEDNEFAMGSGKGKRKDDAQQPAKDRNDEVEG